MNSVCFDFTKNQRHLESLPHGMYAIGSRGKRKYATDKKFAAIPYTAGKMLTVIQLLPLCLEK
jgi:hypothetical protein